MTLPHCSLNGVLCGFVSAETTNDSTYTVSKKRGGSRQQY